MASLGIALVLAARPAAAEEPKLATVLERAGAYVTERVLMSELIARDRTVTAIIDVSYQSEPLVGFLVPIEMRERYESRNGERIKGDARYGQFRQFQVNVDETFAPVIRK